jgi:lipopolysaccharide export system ATP-binding protein
MQKIKLIKISKKFKSKQALKQVSLEFDSNKINGLLGPNGSGKTTLFNIIAGFLSPDEGQILLDGKDLTLLSLSLRSKLGISYLPQEASIFRDMNVYDNIHSIAELFFEKSKSIKVTNNLIQQFSLQSFQKTKGKLLSGGERRRTEIARALASNPKFLLLDEPFAGIDPIALGEIKELVAHLKDKGVGVLITDHNVRETMGLIDRAVLIHEGSVLIEGKPEDIIKNDDVRRVYLGERFSI